jgi:hypothetical protein
LSESRYDAGAGQQAQLPAAGFEQLSDLYADVSRTRRTWQTSFVACEVFALLALALEQAATDTDRLIDTRDFDAGVDQVGMRGPLRWQPPAGQVVIALRSLSLDLLAEYASRMAAGRYPIRQLPMKSQRRRQEITFS